jgi:hypothetical protein
MKCQVLFSQLFILFIFLSLSCTVCSIKYIIVFNAQISYFWELQDNIKIDPKELGYEERDFIL